MSGNTILITGGTSGLGRAMAEAFLNLGNTVIICGRRQERLDQLQEKYPGLGTFRCDVRDAKQRDALYTWVTENYPGVNVLINNAGIQLATDLTHPVDLALVEEEVETNLVAPIHLCSIFSGYLKQRENAVIINISSGLAYAPLAFMPVYCATKAAIHSLTMSLRHQLKNTQVSVFEIVPPSTDTELGYQRRVDATQTHGGAPIADFVSGMLEALKNNVFEAGIGDAKNLMEQREKAFQYMNK